VVDDKSTDNSVAILERFLDPAGVWAGKACTECAHPPPKYKLLVHSENRGAGVTRNDGVAAASGQIILFGESDDVFYEHHAAVCWNMMRQWPNMGFIKMRMDAGKEYVESSFVAHQAPVQTLHPHWQVAIEDTSPMNLCIRRDAHNFIGGYPDGELFHMDMEDGAFMMCLYEAYAGLKWLASPSTLYVRRVDNGLDRRMQQFTSEPGSVALGEQDARYGDQRMDLIDGNLALVRDNLAEYQAMDELMGLDPVEGEGGELHRQRAQAFGHAYGVARAAYTWSHPPTPSPSQGVVPQSAGDGSAAGNAMGREIPWRDDAEWESRYSKREPLAVALLYRGCRPRALRNMVAWLVYCVLANPMRLMLFLDQPYRQEDQERGAGSVCASMAEVGSMFPVHVRAFQEGLSRGNLAARAAAAVVAAVAAAGGAGGVARGNDIVILFELAHETQAPLAMEGDAGGGLRGREGASAGGARGGLGTRSGMEDHGEEVVDYCREVSRATTPGGLAAAAANLAATSGGSGDASDARRRSAATTERQHAAADGGVRDSDRLATEGGGAEQGSMPAQYEHFWGVDFRSSPAPDSDRHLNPSSRPLLYSSEGHGPSDGEVVQNGSGSRDRDEWEGFKVLSSDSISAARVCNELLREKSAGGDGARGRRGTRGNRMGCCVVRRV